MNERRFLPHPTCLNKTFVFQKEHVLELNQLIKQNKLLNLFKSKSKKYFLIKKSLWGKIHTDNVSFIPFCRIIPIYF